MPATNVVAARVEPELAEAFSLAAKLDGTTASGALRKLMREYVAAATAPLNDEARAPAAGNSRHAGSITTQRTDRQQAA